MVRAILKKQQQQLSHKSHGPFNPTFDESKTAPLCRLQLSGGQRLIGQDGDDCINDNTLVIHCR